MQTKYIFVTGGVCSGLGKGIASASMGAILKAMGKSVFVMKFDAYLNVDPGTMNPLRHGEVFVTDDGAETDLDLGHYERFIDIPLSKLSISCTGQIYEKILLKERNGDFLGKDIQIIPHVTNEIKQRIENAAKVSKADFVIIEIGGTVGDIEVEPYLESARQFHREKGHENVLFSHVTLLPYLQVTNELKTKPTQASVRELQRRGIQPDIIFARADSSIPKELTEKISLFCDVEEEAVIPNETLNNIYDVPCMLETFNMSRLLAKKLSFPYKKPVMTEWNRLSKLNTGKKNITIAIVGKYISHGDAYISVHEAVRSAAMHNKSAVKIEYIDSEKLEKKDKKEWKRLESSDGIIVPGGFGDRGIEGKILAAQYAREQKVPYLGLCLGMQIATIEFARNVAGIKGATSEEFSPKAKHQVIHFMPDQKNLRKKGGTMRLGAYPCTLKAGSKVKELYKKQKISERHRHRYEFNNTYRSQLEKNGLKITGMSPNKHIVEIVENADHPFMIGVQFHPEFQSRPLRPHPLFDGLIKAALNSSSRG
ncbi:MAG: CTP synthase [Candidatus Jacksonbacteria bacterium]|nr:CTP synthase [Candidatus Jacksonbacteria bacterium]